ncbi:hypothetical protein MHB42_07070 [Lysinibacillus sp. FSL K6-0232]|uniref:hypothetical protein n=1 Tax=unclassified Lysinibacillus TaxID=2636778 RepID=UPI0030F572F1
MAIIQSIVNHVHIPLFTNIEAGINIEDSPKHLAGLRSLTEQPFEEAVARVRLI